MEQVQTTAPKSKRKLIFPIILTLILLTGATYGVKMYLHGKHFIDTDDAQVDGTINPVVSRITGYVDEIRFEENMPVKSGAVLLKIDDRDLEIKLQQAEAALNNAQANILVAQANAISSEAGADASSVAVSTAQIRVDKTKKDLDRYENLLKDKSATQQQYDMIRADKETADAQLTLAQKQLIAAQRAADAASQQVNVAKSMIEARQADVDYAKLQISYATILAPTSGTASRKNVQTGQLVQAGQTLLSIVQDSDIYITANFKETQMEEMKVGLKATVKVDAFSSTPLDGEVYSFSGATGARFSLLPPDNATGNYVKVVQRVPVRIRLKNVPKNIAPMLKPGMSVSVSVSKSE